LRWVAAKAGRAGYVDFDQSCGRVEWATGYAYAEIEDIHGREVMLGIGSDDGIRIWLNGKLVHDHEVGRGYSANTEHARVRRQPGTNRILVKLVNYLNGWGFGISLPKANF